MTPPLDDLDPPTFQFGPEGRRRRKEQEAEAAHAPAEDPAEDSELEIPSFDKPVAGTPDVPGEDKART
ncbi:MAG: hypothetical protein H0V15_00590, partial [Solirubrobacterales bacterium]|nr:hypothetical protein [Solirubrobacterales bacterium]